MIDLHMHTSVSDGSDKPTELLEKIQQLGIDIFSVTDHDSTGACAEIRRALSDQREKAGEKDLPRFINGVELSCEDEEGKYHILGYAYDLKRGNVVRLTEETHRMRMAKLERRLNYLATTYGFTFSKEDIEKLRKLNNPGKPHIGNLMVQYGYANDRSEAIKKYLNPYSPPEGHIRPEVAITTILADGGIPVLAHPIYGDGDQLIMGNDLIRRIRKLKIFGLKGLECFYSGFVPKQVTEMIALAVRFNMYVTAGSDYHGTNKLIALGDTGLKADPELVPKLSSFLKKALER